MGTLFVVSIQKPSWKNRKSSHSVEKLSPSGRVAQSGERGLRLPELSLKVFALNGENYKYKKFNWEKVAHAPKEGRKKTVNKSGLHITS